MDGQAWSAIAIATAAATWLARRWWTRGFDDDAHGCSGCSAAKPTGLQHLGPPVQPLSARKARGRRPRVG